MKYLPNWLENTFRRNKLSFEDKYRARLEKALSKVHFNNGDENFGDKKFYGLMRGACMNSVLLNNPEFLNITGIYFSRYQRMLGLENQKRVITTEIKRRYNDLIDLAKRGVSLEHLEENVIDYTDRVRIATEVPLREEYIAAISNDDDNGHMK